MPRGLRNDMNGVPQHVILRGNNRQEVFLSDTDYRYFLGCLRRYARPPKCRLHAYVLMPNHVHLLITQDEHRGLSRMVQSLGRQYVRHFNWAHGRTGTLWEGRFRSCLVDSETYLLNLYRYIELNPVRAGLTADPALYPWSSGKVHLGRAASDLVVDHPLYVALGSTDGERQEAYRCLLDPAVDRSLLMQIRKAANENGVLGGPRFMKEMELLGDRRACPPRRGRPPKNASFAQDPEILL